MLNHHVIYIEIDYLIYIIWHKCTNIYMYNNKCIIVPRIINNDDMI